MPLAPIVKARIWFLSRIFGVTMFLDPRRWIGLLLAILGVLLSVVVPFLPTFLARHLSSSETTVVPFRNALTLKRPYIAPLKRPPSPAPHDSDPAPMVSRQRRRHASEDDPPSPHVKFSFEPHPRFTGNISGDTPSSSSLSKPERNAPTSAGDLFRSPDSESTERPQADLPATFFHTLFNNPDAMPSLDSLDLATNPGAQPIQSPSSQSSKRGFRMPRFGKRRISSEQYHREEDASRPKASATDLKTPVTPSFEWYGNEAFAVKRSTTFSASPIDIPPPPPPPPLVAHRRRFSFFHREPSSSRDSRLPVTPPAKDLLTPPLSAPNWTPGTPPITPPLNAVAGPSKQQPPAISPSISPPISPPMPSATLSDILPEQIIELPSRPQRTDPYKQFGVPVPGSDRARAIMKAEKERIRAEKERKEKEKTLKDAEMVAAAAKAEVAKRKEPEMMEARGLEMNNIMAEEGKNPDDEKSKQSPGRSLKLKRNKKSERSPTPKASISDLPDPGTEADMEEEQSWIPMLITIPHPDEFGVLPLLSVVPEESRAYTPASSSTSLPNRPGTAPSGSSNRRGWVFSRRRSDAGGVDNDDKDDQGKERRRMKKVKEKDKSKDKTKHKTKDTEKNKVSGKEEQAKQSKVRLRSKSRDGLGKIPFISSGSKKDRGYSSDTGVPSLTYQLIV